MARLVINLKAAKSAIERKRYAKLVLAEFDKQSHQLAEPVRERLDAVRRKAKEQL